MFQSQPLHIMRLVAALIGGYWQPIHSLAQQGGSMTEVDLPARLLLQAMHIHMSFTILALADHTSTLVTNYPAVVNPHKLATIPW